MQNNTNFPDSQFMLSVLAVTNLANLKIKYYSMKMRAIAHIYLSKLAKDDLSHFYLTIKPKNINSIKYEIIDDILQIYVPDDFIALAELAAYEVLTQLSVFEETSHCVYRVNAIQNDKRSLLKSAEASTNEILLIFEEFDELLLDFDKDIKTNVLHNVYILHLGSSFDSKEVNDASKKGDISTKLFSIASKFDLGRLSEAIISIYEIMDESDLGMALLMNDVNGTPAIALSV